MSHQEKKRMRRLVVIVLSIACSVALAGGLPPGVRDTQNPRDVPPTPAEAVRRFKPFRKDDRTGLAGLGVVE